jgi:hypothetical protein
MFKGVHPQMMLGIAMDNRAGGDHLGVEHGMLTDQAQKIATVAISPIEHGRNAECSIDHHS